MRVLVVHAHPDPESFSTALRQRAVAGLERAGHHVDTLDLYGLDYQPVIEADEHRNYDTVAQAHPDPLVSRHIELVREAEALVFVYPTWWSGLPAILKGWLDRTLIPGVAFALDETGSAGPVRVRPTLTHVRHLVGITTYGSGPVEVRLLGDAGRRTLTRSTRLLCHPRCRTTWLGLHRLDTVEPAKRRTFLDQVENKMAEL